MRALSSSALTVVGLTVVVVSLTGCATMAPSPNAFRTSFLPPVPAARPGDAKPALDGFDAPPAITPVVYSNSAPNLAGPQFPPRPTEADTRLRRAEDRFKEGKRLHIAGDLEGARKQFDQALDMVLNAKDEPTNQPSFDQRFEELVQAIYRYDVGGVNEDARKDPQFDKAPIDEIRTLTFPMDPRIKNRVQGELSATSSQLPLELSDAVLSFINYFSTDRGHRTLVAGLKRMGRYKPMISRILDEEGVPQELIYLAQAESGFLPRAVSYMAAAGMWQFVKFRGNEYGLKQSAYADERLDPEMATRAAARHLRDLYNEFGDWYLAIAAYNCGPGNVNRAILRTGYADVWELRSRGVLPMETSNYVPIILAMTIMAKNPADYGLENIEPDAALEYDSIELRSLTSLALVADATGQSQLEIKELNPALMGNLAPSGYNLHVPKGKRAQLAAALKNIPEERRNAWRLHRAELGDTLAAIAKQYHSTVPALESANRQIIASVEPGDFIVIPAAMVVERPRPAVTRAVRGRTIATKSRTTAKPGVTTAKKPAVASAKPQTSSTAKATQKQSPVAKRASATTTNKKPTPKRQA